MNYFIDTEFLEGKQDKKFLGIKYGETNHTINLISIGIVSSDNREYYAISKEFNLKEAWNRFDLKHDINNGGFKKVYWIRDNVLKSIYDELFKRWLLNVDSLTGDEYVYFNYSNLKRLINKYGKTNKQIAYDIVEFINKDSDLYDALQIPSIKFYGYYCDYDWVVFCWLFGKMINLPKGFPMYCNDLKQELDRVANSLTSFELSKLANPNCSHNVFEGLDTGLLNNRIKCLKDSVHYPKQINEHNALSDAKWNKELYDFLNNLTK